jgi:hypothetical protein
MLMRCPSAVDGRVRPIVTPARCECDDPLADDGVCTWFGHVLPVDAHEVAVALSIRVAALTPAEDDPLLGRLEPLSSLVAA